jgi:hypothetical protein
MVKQEDRDNHDIIERLIAREEEEALAKFRASDFRRRIEKKIQAASKQAIHHPPFHSILRPVWLLPVLAILSGSVLFVLIIHRTPQPDIAAAIEDVLRRTPGVQAIENKPVGKADTGNMSASPMEKTMAAVFYQVIKNTALNQAQIKNSEPPATVLEARPLSLEEIYKILFVDKSIERVLALISS